MQINHKYLSFLMALVLYGCGSDSTVEGPTGPQGPAGANGISSIETLQFTRFNSDTSVCVSGSGLIIQTVLNAQVQSTAIVCDGSNGKNGTNGTNGIDGTQIILVQFCKNSHSTYPSVFPEVGFCINNQLYAVYSANDGFMALITPGTYTSDGIGSSCNFVVGNNCEVTDQ